MPNLSTIERFLHEKFVGLRYHVWLGKPNEMDLCLTNAEFSLSLPSQLVNLHGNTKYTFQQQNDEVYMSISFEDNERVILYLSGNCSSLNRTDFDQLYLLFSGFYYSEISKSDHNELEKIIESTQALTSTLDLKELLNKIISIALTVIPAADAGVFRLFDTETKLLVPRALVGLNDEYYQYKTKIGENISGKVFADQIPRIYHFQEEILTDNDSREHLIFDKQKDTARAMIIVPVMLGEQCIGTLAVLQFFKNRSFAEKDLRLLEGFSSQVAIAYNNAKLYKDAQTRLETVEQLSKELEEKNQLLQQRISVHETLTQLSIKNKGIKTIIDETDRILGMPIGYVDLLDNEVYWGKNKQKKITFDMVSNVISNEQSTPVFTEIQNQDYYFYPIVVGNVKMGCIIVTLFHRLRQMDIVSIEQSASVLALELVKKISLTELHYKKAHEYFNQLLESPDHETVISTAYQFNFTFSSYSFVVLCETPSSIEPYKVEARIQRLLSKLNQELSNINKLVYAYHNKITLLISIENVNYANTIVYHLKNVIKEWEKNERQNLYGGIGSTYRNIEDIAKSYTEANKAISFLLNRNKPGLMRYEDIGVNRFFLTHPNQEIKNFTEEIFSRLRNEKAQNSELEKTLLLYISSNKSAIDTAKKMHIHINTLYQRLKRIEEELDLRFDNPDDMLKIHLACHLKETFY
ncbi:helix-turn-helix domain-containing protein [Neobacillus cucumis]|uniref:helix-turn-helix domain-containing protein n=1 Tax=Neobacillus cucumis TaxID=1740721 RepID=UPI002E1B3C0E|nr:helix-turn-helix domain-containing protein [Neobacillus cucumis]